MQIIQNLEEDQIPHYRSELKSKSAKKINKSKMVSKLSLKNKAKTKALITCPACKVASFDIIIEMNGIKENNPVRTPETHLLFELTKRTTELCKNKKSGNYLNMRWIPLWWT